VLLGSALGLYACDNPTQALYRQRYDSLEECRRDWGDPDDCRPVGGTGGTGGGIGGSGGGAGGSTGAHGGFYYGPRYYWDSASGRPIEVRPDGSTRNIGSLRPAGAGVQVGAESVHLGGVRTGAGFVTRGGFGGSARAFGGVRG
jgi:hypothetical protein